MHMHTNEINIRDPYVFAYEGIYYLYGTRSDTCWGKAEGFDCYMSPDMENWKGPVEIFRRPEDFFATESFWAPECYQYENSFYLLTTFGGTGIKKGIYLLRAERPEGPFSLYGKRLTPDGWACIDGTLYFSEERIYMVFSHSFEDSPEGDICMVELEPDLTGAKTEPVVLFSAREAAWARPVPFAEQEFGIKGDVYLTDGPCLFRMEDGKLYMTWSSWSEGSYAVGVAVSETGDIHGSWRQLPEPIWPQNGGHGMVFQSFSGERYFVLHYPNDLKKEHPCFQKLFMDNGRITLAKM